MYTIPITKGSHNRVCELEMIMLNSSTKKIYSSNLFLKSCTKTLTLFMSS